MESEHKPRFSSPDFARRRTRDSAASERQSTAGDRQPGGSPRASSSLAPWAPPVLTELGRVEDLTAAADAGGGDAPFGSDFL